MDIATYAPNTWEDCCQVARGLVGNPSDDIFVGVYRGVHHALMEISVGLYKQYPHKKMAYAFDFTSPYYGPVVKYLSMEAHGITLKSSEHLSMENEWAGTLGREDLCVFLAKDHPVTGEYYDVDPLMAHLKEKRVVSVCLVHNPQNLPRLAEDVGRQEVRVLRLSHDICIVVCGARARFGSPIAQGMHWGDDFKTQLESAHQAAPENKSWIEEFEKGLPDGVEAYFKDVSLRAWDRAVVSLNGMDAEAVLTALKAKAQLDGDLIGSPNMLETTSPSRWPNLRTFEWMLEKDEDFSRLRSLLVVDAEWGRNNNVSKLLEEAVSEVKSLQGQPIDRGTDG